MHSIIYNNLARLTVDTHVQLTFGAWFFLLLSSSYSGNSSDSFEAYMVVPNIIWVTHVSTFMVQQYWTHWMLHFSSLNGTYSNITFWGVCPHALQLYCHWVIMLNIAALSGMLLLPTAAGLYCLCVSLWDLSFLPLCQHLRLELLATAVYAAGSTYVNQESLHTRAFISPLFTAYICLELVRIIHQTYTPEAG